MPSPFRLFWLVFPFLIPNGGASVAAFRPRLRGTGSHGKSNWIALPGHPGRPGVHTCRFCAQRSVVRHQDAPPGGGGRSAGTCHSVPLSGRLPGGGAVQQALAIQYHWQDAPQRGGRRGGWQECFAASQRDRVKKTTLVKGRMGKVRCRKSKRKTDQRMRTLDMTITKTKGATNRSVPFGPLRSRRAERKRQRKRRCG